MIDMASDSRLTNNQLLVLIGLFHTKSLSTISECLGLSINKIENILTELDDLGWLEKTGCKHG